MGERFLSLTGEIAACILCAALVGGVYRLGNHEGYRRGMADCALASSRAEAAALVRAAQIERAQVAEQVRASLAVQAEKTATGAALVAVQGQFRAEPARPASCDIGAREISVLNGLRGRP